MRVHLLVNTARKDAVQAAKRARDLLHRRNATVAAEWDSAQVLGLEPTTQESFADCDLAVTFGGDGTLIRAAHLCSERGTPILGVYYGTFGFVTQCTGATLAESLNRFMDNRAEYEDRMMVQTDLLRGGQPVVTIHSLNEMVVQRAVTVRMLNFRVRVDGRDLTTYPADGIIVSTATGSTGYNLSADGPILDPRVRALVLTALAPHTLSTRPLVLSPDSAIHLSMQTEGEAVLSADGQSRLHLLSGDELCVQKSSRVTRLMVVKKDDFLEKLGQRLFLNQPVVGASE